MTGPLPRSGDSLNLEVDRILDNSPGMTFYSSCANGCGRALGSACRYCGACACMGIHPVHYYYAEASSESP